jgi:uncharacterized protein YndB with AHSA1/START domain
VAKVWRAITDSEELSGWFPAKVETALAPGATMTFTFPGQPPESNGTIVELAPPRLFAFDWGGEVLRWELSEDGDGTLLVFTHTFDDRARAASFATGWDGCLDGLTSVLDGRPVGEPEPYAPRHESYVELFDLGAGTVEGTDVVFDRAYPWPREVVDAAMRAQDPGEPGVTWEAEEIPGGSRVRLVVRDPDDKAQALRDWKKRLAAVAELSLR